MARKKTDPASSRTLTRDERQSLRDELLRRAAAGELTGDEADSEAERLGLGRFTSKPDLDAFDPDKVAYWPLAMAVAWIAYRTKEAVRDASSKYRAECLEWRWRRYRVGPDGPIQEGWTLDPLSPMSIARLRLGAIHDAASGAGPLVSIKDAEASLRGALREGSIRATGIDFRSSQRREIDPLEWAEAKIVEARNGSDDVRDESGRSYRDVELSSERVRLAWPDRQRTDGLALPPVMPPDGDGYMPLFLAVLWIATKGGSREFDPLDEPVWRSAFDELLAALSSEKVRVIGTKDGSRMPVPAYLFADCAVYLPYAEPSIDMILSRDLYLHSRIYTGEDDWRRDGGDALANRFGDCWSRLVLAKTDVREGWPFVSVLPADDGTGLPGRPSKSKHLIEDEFMRRAQMGELAPTLQAEAEALLGWLAKSHPDRDRPGVGAIKNNIRSAYREARLATK